MLLRPTSKLQSSRRKRLAFSKELQTNVIYYFSLKRQLKKKRKQTCLRLRSISIRWWSLIPTHWCSLSLALVTILILKICTLIEEDSSVEDHQLIKEFSGWLSMKTQTSLRLRNARSSKNLANSWALSHQELDFKKYKYLSSSKGDRPCYLKILGHSLKDLWNTIWTFHNFTDLPQEPRGFRGRMSAIGSIAKCITSGKALNGRYELSDIQHWNNFLLSGTEEES